jgi:hypothetical protein
VQHPGPKRPYRSSSSGSKTLGSNESVESPFQKSEGWQEGARVASVAGVEIDALAGGPVVVVARVTGDQNAPVAQVRAGPGLGGRRERSSILPKVEGGGRRWCASQRRLGVKIEELAGKGRTLLSC